MSQLEKPTHERNPIMNYIETRRIETQKIYLSSVRTVPPSTLARAHQLAPSVTEIKPGVWTVGASTVDIWRPGCTCLVWRNHRRACPHMIAVYLAAGIEPQHGLLPETRQFYAANGIQQPRPTGYTCRLRNTRGRWRYFGKCDVSGWLIFTDGANSTYAQKDDVTHLEVHYA